MNCILKSILLAAFAVYMPVAFAAVSVYDNKVEQLTMPIGVDNTVPRFSWKSFSDSRGFVQKNYRILVGSDSASVAEGKADIWDSGVCSTNRSYLVPFGGKQLNPATTYFWTVAVEGNDGSAAVSPVAKFTTGLFEPAQWKGAKWIGLEPDGEKIVPFIHGIKVPEHLHKGRLIGRYTLPLLRNEFKLSDKPVKSALAFVCGLGHFDLYVNGERQGEHFLDPGWTKYDKEAQYVTFDLTNALRSGAQNAVGVMLGNGFYNIPNERYYKLTGSFGAPKLKMALLITYADGSKQTIVTDEKWKASAGPITYSSIYGGEDYDARLEQNGWNKPGYDASQWKKPVVTNLDINLKSQLGTHLAVRHQLPVVTSKINEKGMRLYDFGQNSSGIVRMKVKGKKGQKVRMRLSELLNPDGTPNQSASGDPFYLEYTIGNDSVVETWQPQFTYYGFRYGQLENAVDATDENPDSLPVLVEVTALHTANAAPQVGTFYCSKPLFNSIYNLIDWAIRSNMASVLTDCPHREKIGWQEQNYLMQNSMLYNYDLSSLFPKIMSDLEASQWDNGTIPTIAPEYVRFADGFEDTPEWGSAFIICPWEIYRWYGDETLMQRHYPAMKRYIEYLGTRADNNIVAYGLGDWFDIAPGKPGRSKLTSNGVTATATYYYDVLTLSKIAQLLGHNDDTKRYTRLASEIKDSYNKTFFHADKGYYDRNSQTANAISLHFGLVPEGREADVLNALVDDIRQRGNALTAGDIGYRYVLRALEEGGRTDVIFDMNSQYDKPGYGWQLAHGATALTESWQAYGFVSNNHLMLGHLMEWLYSGLGGIRQADNSVAFNSLEINPFPVGDVTSASTTYQTPYGVVACSWQRSADKYTMQLTVPTNSTATVTLPAALASQVLDYGTPLAKAQGISNIMPATKGKNDKLTFTAGSGTYSFSVKNPLP
ncbi:MAG: glycoside hydrolase family 78 protein [Muribaculum sp.]|nr:glycoside hydrolase family 78 protein [Muribaculaceae bacterium]MCM1081334.1 glycoside hydrolase family 78 protein [Muribaculum sp.]